ncbi:Membrane protein [Tenacibaculum sp. 190524A02b]
MIRINKSVNIPITVVYIPTFFDLVHPDKEIIIDRENNPIKKAMTPIIRGTKKSFSVTFFKYPPGVVIIDICIIAKTVIKKHPADKVADFKIRLNNLLFLSDTNKFATTVIENPLSNELIKIVCLANSFQYSKVISFFNF